MFITEIEINNILGCKEVKLSFNNNPTPIYVIQSEPRSPLRHSICTGVQLICSQKYANIESLTKLKNIHRGSVRLTFLIPKQSIAASTRTTDVTINQLHEEQTGQSAGEIESDDDAPCTSSQARERELRRQRRKNLKSLPQPRTQHSFHKINACRNFQVDPTQVEYSIDGGRQHSCLLPVFHGKFCTNVDYVLSRLRILDESVNFSGNWLQILSTELLERWNDHENIENPFTVFVNLFSKKNFNQQHILSKLTTSYLIVRTATNVIQKSYALKIFQDVRSVFEFITCTEYTVWFQASLLGKCVEINDITTEEIDFANIRTYIQLKSGDNKRKYIWTDAEHAIQDLLLIAFQLALAFHSKQKIVYLQKLDSLKDYQAMQLATAAYLLKQSNNEINWSCKNYLQRIVKVCIKMSIVAFIEYPGGLPTIPENVNLIKCYKDSKSEECNIKTVEQYSSCTLDCFIDCIENDLKNY